MKVHSQIDIITNSSSELFTFVGPNNLKAIESLICEIGLVLDAPTVNDFQLAVVKDESFELEAREFCGTDSWYEEVLENLDAGNLEEVWRRLKYECYKLPYPYKIILRNGDFEKDITKELVNAVEAVECGNES